MFKKKQNDNKKNCVSNCNTFKEIEDLKPFKKGKVKTNKITNNDLLKK